MPFLAMGVVGLSDLLAGPDVRFRPLLALGPAFAALWCGMRRTALVGMAALVLDVLLSSHSHALGRRQNTLMLAMVAGITVASVFASSGRQKRERLLAEVRSVAEVAQQVLLRPVPRRVGPVHVAVSYTSATAEARIGGDLYEVASTRTGVRVIVGDVQGKGLEAVETAAAVLGAFREAAYDEPELTGVVARIEASLGRQLSGEKFVTAVLAEFDEGDTATLVNCGHPSPLILRQGGVGAFAEPDDVAPPLGLTGLADIRPRPYTIGFAPGDRLLFYTDGVIEARDSEGRFYPLADRSGLLKAADPEKALEEMRSDVLRHVGGRITDDAAMLLVRRR
ncbi:PP2C family protein-serine/threonine phosphatase [Actinoallomurus iriomotensis]|uniref:Membrane protein n=1 Tax=Actinoallomurus iriomotensis TaxID=478107 RepID=A0A9W6SB43_9ACTN|nr:PP2C family protein-serine/threonine phosphatase [Actinoallomurus iriomotensis]GLY90391.1 membrane protein [Actinoallomurus iriomotensis]